MTQVVLQLEQQLLSRETDVTKKYRALFALRNVATSDAVSALERCLLQEDDERTPAARESSALLKHEVAYALGQIGMPSSIGTLEKVLGDPEAHPMVRHEAGEAIGAMGVPEGEPILRRHVTDEVREVRETCELALERLAWLRAQQASANTASSDSVGRASSDSADADADADGAPAVPKHTSVDPAPPVDGNVTVDELLAQLRDDKLSLFERYRAMFALRDRGTREAALALCKSFDDEESALLKHEVAFVLGQMQLRDAAPTLRRVLADKRENIMVRHEAAEALGALTGDMQAHDGTGSADEADDSNDADATLAALREHATDDEAVVAHSALVALDIADYNASGDFQYAETEESLAAQAAAQNK